MWSFLTGKEELATSVWKPQPARAAALRKQAQTMTGLGDYFGALVILDAPEKLDPDNVLTLNDRGDAKLSSNDGPGAYRDYNRVLELDPDNAEALVSRARIRWASYPCDLEGALLDCDNSVALKRGWPGPLRMRGFVKCMMGDFDGALADLDMSYEIQPDRHALQYKEGLRKWKLGDFEGALEDFGFPYMLLPDGSPLRYKDDKVEPGH
jgi:tetratricopeptide (TPR) repeat protein